MGLQATKVGGAAASQESRLDMSYITLADIAYGLGQTPQQYEQQATALEQQAASLRASGNPALAMQADALTTSAAALRQKASEARDSAATQKAVFDITSSILQAGAVVGTTAIQADAARRAAADAAKRQQPGVAMPPMMIPTDTGGGMSTGAMIGLGVGALALVGVVVVLATRKD